MSSSWVEMEVGRSVFKDKRINERFLKICQKMAENIGSSIPDACQNWGLTKGTYRFLSNERIEESEILQGHFLSTRNRFDAADGPILVLHDTTEFSYKKDETSEVENIRKIKIARHRGKGMYDTIEHKTCGILMHASLAVTPEGLPLGLTSVKYWTRKKFKGAKALYRKKNGTRIPIEEKESIKWLQNLQQSDFLLQDPGKCVHIGDRENDIYEFFCEANFLKTNFVIRACVDRLAEECTISEMMAQEEARFSKEISFIDENGNEVTTEVEVTYKTMEVHPPIGKQDQYESIKLTFINARELKDPKDRPKLNWNLITSINTSSNNKVWELISWYKKRWTIEIFFKIIKMICRAEQSKLRTSNRLARLISILSIMTWRIHWITMMARQAVETAIDAVFEKTEQKILEKIDKNKTKLKTIREYLYALAQLGGYLARKSDSPPGPHVIWRGLMRLADIQRGFDLAT